MKFIVSSSELLKAILVAAKAIPSRTTEAILEDYLFDLRDGRLEITASDKEITIRTSVEVTRADEEGRIAVPARQITELLKEIPDQPVTINTIGESSFECAWMTGASTLPYNNPDDYPQIQSAGENPTTVDFPAASLLEGISSTLYASSDEESRPVMCSVFFDIKPGLSTLVASDLQKLICYTTDDVNVEENSSFILKKSHAAVLKSIVGKDIENVNIKFDSKTAVFSFGNVEMICCLVAGKYPDYNTIIPKNNSNVLRISRTLLLNMVRRIAVCSPKASSHIKFELTQGSLEISAQDLGYALAAHEKVECSYEGDDLAIGFKSTHLIEMLSNLSCDEVMIKFADKRRSVLILASEAESAVQKVFGIVMPIMVR